MTVKIEETFHMAPASVVEIYNYCIPINQLRMTVLNLLDIALAVKLEAFYVAKVISPSGGRNIFQI